MASIDVKNMQGESVGSMDISDDVFDIKVRPHIIHMAVVQYLANQRQGNKSTKTRSEVRGGGRKPWRQKGTGRARQGTIRAPQWKGGGVVFAPKPRDFSIKLNRKVKRLAIKCVLSEKYQSGKLTVLDTLALEEIKTKAMVGVCKALDASNAMFVMEGDNKNVVCSARNIPGIHTAGVNTINVYDIMRHEHLILTKDAVSKMQEVYA